jgi:hypothetical protein
MSDCKTVTHEGNVYEIGSVYEFSDDGVDWALDYLLEVGNNPTFPFEAKQYEWELIRKANYTMGTITPAPIDLIDGNAYMFNPHNTTLLDVIGLYEKKTNQFYCNGWSIILAHCSIIRPMTVAEKK